MKWVVAFLTGTLLASGWVSSGIAQSLAGVPSVIDGDTLEIAGQRIRFHGIDAPESAQLCTSTGGKYRCGAQAANALSEFIDRRPIRCEERDLDRYGRIVAVCLLDGIDLNGWMVSNGYAVAYRQYSSDYIEVEEHAQAAKRGIWSGSFDMPWDWRRAQRGGSSASAARKDAQVAASGQCDIKGNINSKGERIYHVPGGRFYDRTQINGSNGERMFCSEQEASAAGWRRSRQ